MLARVFVLALLLLPLLAAVLARAGVTSTAVTGADEGVLVVYICSEHRVGMGSTEGRCEELAVSLYSMAVMLKPERNSVDQRAINATVLANAACGDCLSKILTKMAKALGGKVAVTILRSESLPAWESVAQKFAAPGMAMKALLPFVLPERDRLVIMDSYVRTEWPV